MALSKTTQDHDEIRRWAEARGGKPAEVTSTSKPGAPGILRFEFPSAAGANDANLNEIPWEEFFKKFDASGLSLVYQEVTSEGAESNFNRLVYPENLSTSARKSTGKKVASAKKSAKQTAPAKASGKKAAPEKAPAKSPDKSPEKSTAKPSAKAAAPNKTAAKTTATKSAAAKPVKKSTNKSTPATSQAAAKKTTGTKASGRTAAAPAKTSTKSSAKQTPQAGAQQAAVAIKNPGTIKPSAPKKASAAKKSVR